MGGPSATFASVKGGACQPGGEDGADAADLVDPDLQDGELDLLVLLHLLLLLEDLLSSGLRLAGPLLSGCHQLKSCVESAAYQGCQLAPTSGAPYSRSFPSLLQESVCCCFRSYCCPKILLKNVHLISQVPVSE